VNVVEILFKFALLQKHAELPTTDPLRAKCTTLRSKQLSFSTDISCDYVFNISQKKLLTVFQIPSNRKPGIHQDKTPKEKDFSEDRQSQNTFPVPLLNSKRSISSRRSTRLALSHTCLCRIQNGP